MIPPTSCFLLMLSICTRNILSSSGVWEPLVVNQYRNREAYLEEDWRLGTWETEHYVDKTSFILDLIQNNRRHFLITRPSGFGKTLLWMALVEIFHGRKESFNGLAIHRSSYNWTEYPVIYFCFASTTCDTYDNFNYSLRWNAGKTKLLEYKLEEDPVTLRDRIQTRIMDLSKKKKVVVLIDDYDRPIYPNPKEISEANCKLLRVFYDTLRDLDDHIRFTYVTGELKFSHDCMFSDPNHLEDISMNAAYTKMLGFTGDELKSPFMSKIIRKLSRRRAKDNSSMSARNKMIQIREWFDGYRFSQQEYTIYRPEDVLEYIVHETYYPNDARYPGTGQWLYEDLSLLSDTLENHMESLVSSSISAVSQDQLVIDIYNPNEINVIALLFQRGYFTMAEYCSETERYRLDFPNKKRQFQFIYHILKHFKPHLFTLQLDNLPCERYVLELQQNISDPLFEFIASVFAKLPAALFKDSKISSYQDVLRGILHQMGFDSKGNTKYIDLDVGATVYIMKLKVHSSAENSLKEIFGKFLKQILDKRGYMLQDRKRSFILVGLNLSFKNETLLTWSTKVHEASQV